MQTFHNGLIEILCSSLDCQLFFIKYCSVVIELKSHCKKFLSFLSIKILFCCDEACSKKLLNCVQMSLKFIGYLIHAYIQQNTKSNLIQLKFV